MGGKQSVPEVDLHNKVAIVTGGNAGIGCETAKAIAVMGAHTIIACRSKDKATAVSDHVAYHHYFCSVQGCGTNETRNSTRTFCRPSGDHRVYDTGLGII